MNLNNVYSAVIESLKGQRITADINEVINIERLKTMYYGYDGPREVEIRFIDPRQFTAAQRNFIYALFVVCNDHSQIRRSQTKRNEV